MNQLLPVQSADASPSLIAPAGARARSSGSSGSSRPTSATATPAAPTRRQWCEHRRVPEITDVQPVHVAGYIEELTRARCVSRD
jgi:hypothetical protein